MRIETGIMLLGVSALLGQSTTGAWKEFSVGQATANRTRFGQEGFRAEGVPFRRVLAKAYGLPEHRIIGPAWINDQRYALTALVNDPKDFQPLMQQELAMRWHMLAHREMKDVPVYEIRTLNGAPMESHPVEIGKGQMGATIRLNQTSVKSFADILADTLERPVFDETNLDSRFDLVFTWTSTDPKWLKAAMSSQLGLDLVDTRRAVDILVIDHIEKLP